MMSCKKIANLVAVSLDRPLSLRERLAVVAHSLICVGCTHYNKQMLFIRAASRRIAEQWDANNDGPRLSSDAVCRIKNSMNKNNNLE